MKESDISKVMQSYIENNEMAGGALIVRKAGDIVYQNKWGYADIKNKKPIEYDSIYRMCSMTKCVTGVAIMQLIERGMLGLDDKVSKYIPEFANMKVISDARYIKLNEQDFIQKVKTLSLEDDINTVDANRELTIRDLLSHSSGLEQGIYGYSSMMNMKKMDKTLQERALRYSNYILDFQPGTGTGYSGIASFDILGYIITVVTGMSITEYMTKELFIPMEMNDMTFFLNEEQKKRLVKLYKREQDEFIDVSDTKEDIWSILYMDGPDFEAACGGIFGTITDYEHMADMLCNEGTYKGKQILKPETVCLMHSEAPAMHLEPEPGFVWGLGVKIRQNPDLSDCFAHRGTYGWSGAFGTHFFICPDEKLEAVFVMNRSDIGGASSYISKKVEELVFGIYGENK